MIAIVLCVQYLAGKVISLQKYMWMIFCLLKVKARKIKIWLSDYGIAINRYSKTNKDNRLYSREVATGGKFCGNITVYFDDETIRYKRNIEMAMKMVNSIGGGHSKGFGRAEVQWEEV